MRPWPPAWRRPWTITTASTVESWSPRLRSDRHHSRGSGAGIRPTHHASPPGQGSQGPRGPGASGVAGSSLQRGVLTSLRRPDNWGISASSVPVGAASLGRGGESRCDRPWETERDPHPPPQFRSARVGQRRAPKPAAGVARGLAGKPSAGFCTTPSRRITVVYGVIVYAIRFKTPSLHR